MDCPSCSSPITANVQLCAVCGYRLQARPPARPAGAVAPASPSVPASAASSRASPPRAPASPGSRPPVKPPPAIRPVPRPQPVRAPERVLDDRYKIEEKIGEGGFGAVYRGVQLATKRKVAIKLLHPDVSKDQNVIARFRREGMLLCNLRDEHTITTYEFDQTADGTLYIAMELLEGKSLHQICREEAPLDWQRVFMILIQMCSALAEAHSQGIVHRDLKPENIYLESRPGNPDFVKILDFGIAKVMRGDGSDPQTPQLTASGQTLGTLEYMSPEQLMGQQLDGRSDAYALGVLAYELITKRLPFPDAKGPVGLLTAQGSPPPPLSTANPQIEIPPDADRAILKALEKHRENRYTDVTAMAVALSEIVARAHEPAPAVAPPPVISSNRPVLVAEDPVESRRREVPVAADPPVPLRAPTPEPPTLPPPRVPVEVPVVDSARSPRPPVRPPLARLDTAGRHRQPGNTGSSSLIWLVVGILALGAVTGAVVGLLMR
jgi:serine/threonine protein kinase